MSKKQSPLFALFFTMLLDMLGFGILIPVIPVLLAQPDSLYYLLTAGTSVGTSYIILGLLFACFSFGQFSDKLGRKRLLTLSVFGTSLGHALFAIGVCTALIHAGDDRQLLRFCRPADCDYSGNHFASTFKSSLTLSWYVSQGSIFSDRKRTLRTR